MSASDATAGQVLSWRQIRTNFSAVGASYVVGGIAGVFAQALLARKLGHAGFGVYVAAFTLVEIVRVIEGLQGEEYVVREGARERSRLDELLGDLTFLKLVSGITLVIVATGVAAALGYGKTGVIVTAILAGRAAAASLTDAFRAGLQALERLHVAAIISSGISIIGAAAIVVLLLSGGGVVAAAAGVAVTAVCAVPVAYVAVRRHVRISLRASWSAMLRLTRSALPFAAVAILGMGVTYADAVIIRILLGEEATGLYGAAYRIVVVLAWIPSVFHTAAFRSAAALAHHAPVEFRDFVERSAAGLAVAALPFAAGGIVIGDRILTLVFGEDFAPAGDTFKILLWSLPFTFTAIVLLIAVVVGDRPGRAGWILAPAFTGNVVANILLIPHYGIEVSAWLTVATEAGVAIGATIVLARSGLYINWIGRGAPGLVAAAAMAGAIVPLRDLPLAVPLVVGALVFAGVAIITRLPRRFGITRGGGR